MSGVSRELSKLVGKMARSINDKKLTLTSGEIEKLEQLMGRQQENTSASLKIVKEVVTKIEPITLFGAASSLTINSGGVLDLNGNTLTLMGANGSLMVYSGGVLSMGGNTLTVTGAASVSGTNTGDETLAATSGLTLSSHVLAVGAGDGIDVLTNSIAVDQTFSPTWTGAHTFQQNLITRHILPETTDTYDLGSPTALWRKGYLSELDALIFAENTISLVGGWLMLCKDQGTLPTDMASTDTTYDFGEGMTPNDFLVFRAALKVEYMQVGSLVSGTTYNITRNLDGTGANDWAAGTPYANYGYNGNGRLELNAYNTPRISLMTHGTLYNSQTETLRMGDLNANWGYSSATYGLAIGNYAAGAINLTMESANGYRLRTYDITQFQVTPNLLKFGSNVSAAGTTAIAIMGADQTYNSENLGSGDLLIGDNTASKANMLWDKSAGTFLFRGGTTTQLYIDTDGSLITYNNIVKINRDGLMINVGTSYDKLKGYRFGSGDTLISEIYAFYNSNNDNKLKIETEILNTPTMIEIMSNAAAGYEAKVFLTAKSSTTEVYFIIGANSYPLSRYAYLNAQLQINANSTTALLVEQDGVKDNVLVVDTTNGGVGINAAAESGIKLNVGNYVRFSNYGDILGRADNESYIRISGGGSAGNGAAILMYGNSSATYPGIMRLYAGSSVRMSILANGNVGIADTEPAEILDVTGNINATGVYKVDDVQVVNNRYINSYIGNNLDLDYGQNELNFLNAVKACLIHHGLAAAS